MIDRKVFYEGVRNRLFGGKLSQSQVDGMNAILDEWEHRNLTDLRHLAYMLATTKWETAHTMQPIAEYGKGRGHSYGVPDPQTGQTYYGRGFVQLTWKSNYQKMAALTGVDLVNKPDLAMDPKVATLVLFDGMRDGLFTGVGLPKYFNDATADWVNARRIINGLDKAEEIAVLGRTFHEVLKAASEKESSMSDDLKTKVEAAGKALGDQSNAVVQAQAGWFMKNKLYIVGGIAAAVVLAILVLG